VIPEKVGVTLEGKSAGTDAVMQALADQTAATVVAGVVHVDAPAKYNEARVYEPGSAVQGRGPWTSTRHRPHSSRRSLA
jgi:hypothetical protein